jgi:hypothetical protein
VADAGAAVPSFTWPRRDDPAAPAAAPGSPPQLVEALGYCAEPTDVDARTALESLRSQSGEAFHVSYETVDQNDLDWRERLVAERKGIPADLIRARIIHRPTGLLEREVLNAALERIQARARPPRP